jgi:hypothetical protein
LFVYSSGWMCFSPSTFLSFIFDFMSCLSICNYLYLHCAVPVIGLVAIDSAHK